MLRLWAQIFTGRVLGTQTKAGCTGGRGLVSECMEECVLGGVYSMGERTSGEQISLFVTETDQSKTTKSHMFNM